MPKVFTSEKQKIGELGEKMAKMFLVKHGFNVVAQNYTKKWGEIDIIACKNKTLHFIEVKSVSRKTNLLNVSRETIEPEDNMHPKKLERLYRTIETYLAEKQVSHETEWQLDLACVYLDHIKKTAKVKFIENIR